jgi:hypothetical protein
MKSKILVFGFACLSVVAVAQSNEKQSKEKQNQLPAAVKSQRDIVWFASPPNSVFGSISTAYF